MNKTTVLVDVREDIRGGREPFSKVMNAAAALHPDEQLLLLAPFEPVPLFYALKKQGFRHSAHPKESGDWEVLFVRESDGQTTDAAVAAVSPPVNDAAAACSTEIVEVDARGLEPPLPLVKILEALALLPAGAELRGRTDRRPIHLYAQLEERGFTAQSEEQSDGSFLTHIRRA
jgi:uncharacterized protein (DUF2249 family)